MATNNYLFEDCRSQIEKGKVIAIIGAGVSIAATRGQPVASWIGLLDHGLERCKNLSSNLASDWSSKVYSQIHSGDLNSLLLGSHEILGRLRAPLGGEYRRWLRETVGALTAVDRRVLDALVSLDVSLATTNYDNLLEEITGLRAITWKDHSEVERFLRGDDRAILHLHGYWRRPETVIIDSDSYNKALGDQHFQFMIRALRAIQTFMFVGYGAGLKDPNFVAFLSWSSSIFSESEYRHFRLALNDEIDARQAEHSEGERIYVIGYGDSYDKLPSFLSRLQPERSRLRKLAPDNLPVRVSSFIGRNSEVLNLQKLLSARNVRLLTLTGTGGVGKTRLAIEVATRTKQQFPAGVWFVDLDGLTNPTFIWTRIASVFGIKEKAGKRSLLELIKEYVQSNQALVILDTCENLLPECSKVVLSLIQECPKLKVLATSREALNVEGETRWEVPPMDYPNSSSKTDQIAECDAVKLFLARSAEARPSMQIGTGQLRVIGDICKRLDGIPLAIELAASRIKDLGTVEHISERLHNRFELLVKKGPVAPIRQQTLLATIAWSYEMLDASECDLLKRLAVFVGGWTLESAESICAGPDLEKGKIMNLQRSLLDKSLVVLYDSQGKVRYRLLDSIKEYAWQRLTSEEQQNIQRCHADYFWKLSEEAESDLWGENQKKWVGRLEGEHDNLRAALTWSQEYSPDLTLKIGSNLWRFWQLHCHFREGAHWLSLALEKNPSISIERARTLLGAAYLARDLWDTDKAQGLSEESIRLFHDLGDERGEAMAISNLAILERSKGNYALAERLFQQSLQQAIKAGDRRAVGSRMANLGITAYNAGHFEDAESYFKKSIPLLREWGERHILVLALRFLGLLMEAKKEFAKAKKCYVESRDVAESIGDKVGVGASLCHLGNLAAIQGDYPFARTQLLKSLSILRDVGDKLEEAWTLDALAGLLFGRKKYWMSNIFYHGALKTFRQIENKRGMSRCLCLLGVLSVTRRENKEGLMLISLATASHPLDSMLMGKKKRDLYDRTLKRLHKSLSPNIYAEIWGKGQSLNLLSVVDHVLSSKDIQGFMQ